MTVLGRVKVGAERGTVRYVGQVQGAQGTWYGIEWDDPSRGKHDGSHKGVKYFACSHATGGSFVKEKKVNRGVSFLQALETRYGEEEAASHVEVNVRQRIEVELVGEDRVRSRIQRHDELREAQLRDMDINDTVEDTLAERCPNVNILDLSFNLICKWSTVVAICKQLPRLTSLNISGNRLDFDTIDEETAAFHDVTCLYLSHIPGLQWDQVVQICRHMPNLTELHACENGMEHINMDAETVRVFGRLHTLNMYGNALHAWSKVLALGELPALSDLKLNANQLGDCTDFTPLSSLASLSIASNEISSWETVKALGKLTGLTSVRMRHNPVGSGVTEAVYRKLCIHHLPHVQVLNGSHVPAREREIAQRFYIEYTKPKEENANTLAAQLLPLQVEIDTQSQDDAPKRAFEVRVPPRITIGKLKRLLQASHFTNIRAADQRLTLIDQECGAISLDDDLRELSYFSVAATSVLTVLSAP